MRSLRPLAASGLSNPLHNLTTEHPCRRVGEEHRRVSHLEPDDNKPLSYAGYSGYRRVRRVL
jgi:hypothetical protein